MPEPQFVQIKTADGLTLPGLIYRAGKTKSAAIYLHGNGSASCFYSDDERGQLAQTLAQKGISLLLFNNRGAHYVKKLVVEKQGRGRGKLYGMAFEKIKECRFDIEGAVKFLSSLGYKTFYLIGESTGANKICVYHYYHRRNLIAKYVLLGGGDDVGIYYHLLGQQKFWSLLEKSKLMIKVRHGQDYIPELLNIGELFSYQGFYDLANPDGDYNIFPFYEILNKVTLSKKTLLRHFRSLTKPTLVVYGERDEYAWGKIPEIIELLKKANPRLDYSVIPGADHACSQHQKELGNIVTNWLA
ncbi:MAG: hypothetical protein A2445_04335 [Candidatus Jacksonbacteria bacterium RIFOXYC2_FULL_44_29]|nr:MAG: hypothetical protein UW45_C0044G0005 [Parcubacteria group bacterium GW2011_GWC2_44_22]OGY76252.1 MAG: hypothetical protein A2240_00920 [Candidatus Jacksonbacteria bacterium RIFOXYA2_FULL_43_12]OGY76671.1 MAG: hypothetical protein A2295_05045 [Candidatus Jacksonbacteria bacterium RIFOXYB2_FULL_44_15]OGY78045.1 MAG: hypothetical protein A2550_03380 [Candidatus Jacksonbacteria bacterium RIFOXYD2_FULL_43_21]OGY79457.1 MAG: hypothetical protein A2445_04335 [Candidatus Jacksonbacteria bacteri